MVLRETKCSERDDVATRVRCEAKEGYDEESSEWMEQGSDAIPEGFWGNERTQIDGARRRRKTSSLEGSAFQQCIPDGVLLQYPQIINSTGITTVQSSNSV